MNEFVIAHLLIELTNCSEQAYIWIQRSTTNLIVAIGVSSQHAMCEYAANFTAQDKDELWRIHFVQLLFILMSIRYAMYTALNRYKEDPLEAS